MSTCSLPIKLTPFAKVPLKDNGAIKYDTHMKLKQKRHSAAIYLGLNLVNRINVVEELPCVL